MSKSGRNGMIDQLMAKKLYVISATCSSGDISGTDWDLSMNLGNIIKDFILHTTFTNQ